jgi:hypothetical protein
MQLKILTQVKQEYVKQIKNVEDDSINKITNLFQQLENIKIQEIKEIAPFKGGLPHMPLVVSLIGKLPDNVNNLISKFVGYQSKPVVQLINIVDEIKQDIVVNENSDIQRISIRIHLNHCKYEMRKRYGCVIKNMLNELNDPNITNEKVRLLRLRFERMTERYRANFIEMSNEEHRQMLNIMQ